MLVLVPGQGGRYMPSRINRITVSICHIVSHAESHKIDNPGFELHWGYSIATPILLFSLLVRHRTLAVMYAENAQKDAESF